MSEEKKLEKNEEKEEKTIKSPRKKTEKSDKSVEKKTTKKEKKEDKKEEIKEAKTEKKVNKEKTAKVEDDKTKEKKEKAEDKKKEVKPKKSKSKDKATKIEENKDIKDDTKKENIDQNENKTPKAGKRLFAFSLVGGIAVVLIIILAIIFISMAGKPSKAKSEELVKDYLKAVNDDDADEFAKLIDVKGYIIFNEESEKKFDKKYKNKNYINDYLKDNNYDELSDAKDAISSKFKNKYTYSSKEYSLKEITEVKKSTKSKKVKIIKAKVKVKTSYSSSADTANLKLYVIKVDGEYKIVSAELD